MRCPSSTGVRNVEIHTDERQDQSTKASCCSAGQGRHQNETGGQFQAKPHQWTRRHLVLSLVHLASSGSNNVLHASSWYQPRSSRPQKRPFQMMVLLAAMVAAFSLMVSGPQSNPMEPSGIPTSTAAVPISPSSPNLQEAMNRRRPYWSHRERHTDLSLSFVGSRCPTIRVPSQTAVSFRLAMNSPQCVVFLPCCNIHCSLTTWLLYRR